MKSPHDIALRMRRQWGKKTFRLEMLTSADAWPMQYSIGKPSASDIAGKPTAIQEHVTRWQKNKVGKVSWHDVNYRVSSEPIRMPTHWTIERPSDWIQATDSRQVFTEFSLLENLFNHAQTELREPLIRNIKLLQGRSREELLNALKLAARLSPGEAQGRPLRLLAGYGIDTKFFERNQKLVTRLLDVRFDGEVSKQGLHGFLDAPSDGEHWLLLVALQEGLLAFENQQVRSRELANLPEGIIRASRILVVENRQCWHYLPKLHDTVAILGGGLDLDWLKAGWLDNKHIAYWGDMDTWGLDMLARVRQLRPEVTPLLMDRKTFDQFAVGNAVAEPVKFGLNPPLGLSHNEQKFYQWLMSIECGRLEQEYLPEAAVHDTLKKWAAAYN